MKKIAFVTGTLGWVVSYTALAEINLFSLHAVGHTFTSVWVGLNPLLGLAGLLILAGTVMYRLKRAK